MPFLPQRIDPRVLTLLDVTKAMTSTLEIDDLLQRIVCAVTQVLPCEGCILWLLDKDTGQLRPMTIHGFTWEEVGTHEFSPGEGTIGSAFSEQRTVITNDLKRFAKFVRKGDVVDRIVSLLDVPMILDGRSIGVLDAANKIPGNDFNDDDGGMLSLLASQAAIAIDNARAHSEIRRRAYELEMLHSITQVMGTNLETRDVIRIIARETLKLLNFNDCSVFLYDSLNRRFELAAAIGSREHQVGRLWVPFDDGLISYTARTRKTVMVSNEDLDEYRNCSPADYDGFRTVIAAALFLPDKLLGVIEVRERTVRDLTDEDLMLLKTIVQQMAVFLEKANLYHTVQELYLEVIKSLCETVEAKDPETIGHCYRVSEYAVRLAREMKLEEEVIEQIRVAAHLHDIGKIGIPEAILLKADRLTSEEYATIKQHSEIGAKILTPIEFFGNVTAFVRYHHERFDGNGYPDNLKGKGIPIGARILAVADSFEAMTWHRPYHDSLLPAEALEEVLKCSGTQFDPDVVRAFRSVFDQIVDINVEKTELMKRQDKTTD